MPVLVRAVRVFAVAVIVAGAFRFMQSVMAVRGAIVRVRMAVRVLVTVGVAMRVRMHKIAMPVLMIMAMGMIMAMAVLMLVSMGLIVSVIVGASVIWIVHQNPPPMEELCKALRFLASRYAAYSAGAMAGRPSSLSKPISR